MRGILILAHQRLRSVLIKFDAPDAASMEDDISKFVEGFESQEHSGFDDIHRLVKGLSVPVTKAIRLRVITHAEAINAQFLPNMVGMSVEKTFKRQVAAGEVRKERAAEKL